MPNNNPRFNPAYSTVKSIFLGEIDVLQTNVVCRFERLETVENVNEVFPRGVLVLVDLNDVVTYIGMTGTQTLTIEFMDGTTWFGDITSVSYENNAASDTEETLVTVHFTNSYYKYFSSKSLTTLLGYKKPNVFQIDEFVGLMKNWVFGASGANQGYVDSAKNYFLYKPLNPFEYGDETPTDNAIELMNYLTTSAIDPKTNTPNFLFWTSFGGGFNFKTFRANPTQDASYSSINSDYRNFAIYDGDAVLQKISSSDNKKYRKIYWMTTNPGFQWVSKNYYYIRKTPKYVDKLERMPVDEGLTGEALINAINAADAAEKKEALNNLAFQFQDDGQKYNIDVITKDGRGTNAPPGGNFIYPENSWGYYELTSPTNDISINSLLGNEYGTSNAYKSMNLMGLNGFMPYLDSPDMWKNMFNITPVHPHHPFERTINPETGISGADTVLQKIIDIRYDVFKGTDGASGSSGSSGGSGSTGNSGSSGSVDLLTKIRNIEAQNFIMYSLCCMGKREDCFFAVLQRYEPDSAYYYNGTTGSSGASGGTGGTSGSSGPYLPNGAKFYRYKWNKINFNGNCGNSGNSGASGGTGASGGLTPIGSGGFSFLVGGSGGSGASGSSGGNTYQAHQLELWELDPAIKSSETQDETWAINLNERGLSAGYLPPGWVKANTGNFKYRPIGASASSNITTSADINHIARVCIEQIDGNNKVVYFWAENVLDGDC